MSSTGTWRKVIQQEGRSELYMYAGEGDTAGEIERALRVPGGR